MLRLGCNIDKHEHDEDEESKGESDDKRSVDSLGCDPFSFLLDRFFLFDRRTPCLAYPVAHNG